MSPLLDDLTFSKPSTYHQTGVHPGYSTVKADSSHLINRLVRYPDRYGKKPPLRLWYAKLDPGGYIVPHSDQGPWMERWHYPIEPAGWVWQESEGFHKAPSEPFPMRHWEPHAVWNDDNTPRIHLIVEYDNPIDHPDADLTLYPMLPEMDEVVAQMTRV